MKKNLSSPVLTLFVSLLFVSLGACVTTAKQQTSNGNPSSNASQKPVQSRPGQSEFLEVYVPGSTKNVLYGNSNSVPDPLLNPKSPPPLFAEEEMVTAHCRPGALGNVSSADERYFIDREQFDSLMKESLILAKERHVWKFNASRANAQKGVIDQTFKRLGPAGVARLQSQREIYLKEAHKPFQQRSMAAKLNSPEQNQMTTLPEMQERLSHNFRILEKQDVPLRDQEREFTLQMIGFYEIAFNELRSVASSRSLVLLNRYEKLRQNNLFTCMGRFNRSEVEKARTQVIDTQVRAIAREILMANRAQLLSAMSEARLIVEKKKIYNEAFSTVLLQEIAQVDLGIAPPDGGKIRPVGQGGLTL